MIIFAKMVRSRTMRRLAKTVTVKSWANAKTEATTCSNSHFRLSSPDTDGGPSFLFFFESDAAASNGRPSPATDFEAAGAVPFLAAKCDDGGLLPPLRLCARALLVLLVPRQL